MNQQYRPPWITVLAISVFFVWCYQTVLVELMKTWEKDPTYSHGWLVAPLALLLVWSRRKTFPTEFGASWTGLGLLLVGLLMLAGGWVFDVVPVRQFSIIPSLAGVVWMLGGWPVLRWSAPFIGFLIFMIPLPYSVAVAQASQLQRLAALWSSYLLRTLGITALAEANIIQLESQQIDVAYACSGLQMMIAFLAVTSAIALLSSYPLLGKIAIVASAIPIAVVCNVLRITATGVGYQMYSAESVREVFHDLGGYILIPVAIGFVFLEIHLFQLCFPSRRPADASRRPVHGRSRWFDRKPNWKWISAVVGVTAMGIGGIAYRHGTQMPRILTFLEDRSRNLERAGDLESAVHYQRLCLSLAPQNKEVFNRLGILLASVNNPAAQWEAVRKLSQTLRLSPDDRKAKVALLDLALRRRDRAAAVELAKELESSGPADPAEWKRIARAYQFREEYPAAVNAYEKALAGAPKDLTIYPPYLDALARVDADKTRIEAVLTKLTSENDNDPSAHLVAYVVRRDQKLPGAAAPLAEAQRLGPENLEVVLMSAGDALSRQSKEVGRWLQKAYSIAPKDPRVLQIYGKWLFENGDPLRALEMLDRGFTASGRSDPELAWRIAEVLLELRRFERLGIYLGALVGNASYRPVYLFLRGRQEMLDGNLNEALDLLNKGLALINSAEYIDTTEDYRHELRYKFTLSLAGVQFNLGMIAESLDLAKKARQMMPAEAAPLMTIGGINAAVAEYDDAVDAWKQARECRFVPRIVPFELARVLLHRELAKPKATRNFDEYQKMAEEARRTTPDFPDLSLLDAEHKLGIGDSKSAITSLVAGVQAHPGNRELCISLLRVLMSTGDYERAKAWLIKVRNAIGSPIPLVVSEAHLAFHLNLQQPAVELLERRLNKANSNDRVVLLVALANHASAADKPDVEQKWLKELVAESPDGPTSKALLAEFYLRKGAIDDARKMLAESEKLAVDDPFKLWLEAHLLTNETEKSSAARVELQSSWERLFRKQPYWWGTAELAGLIAQAESDSSRAIERFTHALRTGPATPTQVARLVRLQIEAGRLDDAHETLHQTAQRRLLTSVDKTSQADLTRARQEAAKRAAEKAASEKAADAATPKAEN